MKKCPYCSEEIQDAALKCRYCGEWLNNEENKAEEDGSNNSGLAVPIESSNRTKEEHKLLVPQAIQDSVLADEIKETEKPPKTELLMKSIRPKWGWGGFILFCLIGTGTRKVSLYSTEFGSLLTLLCPFLAVVFYFWYRKRLFARNPNVEKVWTLSLQAGFVAYLLAMGIMFIAVTWASIQEKKDNKAFFSKYAAATTQLKKDKASLEKLMVLSPETIEDVKGNAKLLEEFIAINEKTRKTYNELISYMEKLCDKKNDNQLKQIVQQVKTISEKLFNINKEQTEALLKYYESGDDADFEIYSILAKKAEDISKDYVESEKKMLGKVRL